MLVLTRGYDKSIKIGDNVEVKIIGFMMMNDEGKWVKVRHDYPVQVQLGIEAPRSVQIMRGEALEKSTKNVDKMVENRDEVRREQEEEQERKRPRRERRRRQRSHR